MANIWQMLFAESERRDGRQRNSKAGTAKALPISKRNVDHLTVFSFFSQRTL